MVELALPVPARTRGAATLAEIASNVARSQVIVRLFTLVY
jgi:hypothetical protein